METGDNVPIIKKMGYTTSQSGVRYPRLAIPRELVKSNLVSITEMADGNLIIKFLKEAPK